MNPLPSFDLYKPTSLRKFLQEEGLHAKKGLSQNFLIDKHVLEKIITLAGVKERDVVLEIGPGVGVLTEALLKQKASVIAIEKDLKLAPLLKRLDPEERFLSIFLEDALKVDSERLIRDLCEKNKQQKGKLIANIPYNITSPLLFKFLPAFSFLESLTLMVQKEVAIKCLAPQGDENYGFHALFTAFYSTGKIGINVPRTAFFPPPNVDSAVLHLTLKEAPLKEKEASLFFILLRKAFGYRRKTLATSLSTLYPKTAVQKALEELYLPLDTRPEALLLDQFLSLFKILHLEKIIDLFRNSI